MKAIHWTDEAMEQVLGIREYLSVTSPGYAAQYIDNLFDRVKQLISFLQSGPQYSAGGLAQPRELLVRPYRVVYEVTDKQIRIMAVFHQRQKK